MIYKHQIGINDSYNGVYLPTHKDSSGAPGIQHSGKHPDSYVRKINQIIVDADNFNGKVEVLNKLEEVRKILENADRKDKWGGII